MNMAQLAAERSSCLRRKVGAVAVLDKRVVATGYNGAPMGVLECLERGCLRQELNVPSGERHELCRGVHAEQNLITQAALHGVKLDGCTVYCTNQPCFICAKLLVNVRCKTVYFKDPYPDQMTTDLLYEAGIDLRLIP